MSWPTRWRGRWIWWHALRLTPDEVWDGVERPRPADSFCYLRRSFTLDAPPTAARARITADGRSILFVNGIELARGPIRSEPAHLHYEDVDIAAALRTGENVIAIFARHYGGPTVHWKPAQPVGDLGFGSVVAEAEITSSAGTLVIATDDTWRAQLAPYARTGPRPEGPPPPEHIDGAGIPRGWNTPGFDDSSWPTAELVEPYGLSVVDPAPPTEPFQFLRRSPLPAMDAHAVSVPGGSFALAEGEARTFDLGAIVVAHPTLTIDADAGTEIELTCGEDLGEDGAPVTAPREWELRYRAAGDGSETVEAFECVGFRYLQVRALRGGARAVELGAIERHYPRTPGAYFRCSEPLLEQIWEAGARSLDLCSLDAFVDCPGREQRAWLGDAFLTTLISMIANPDVRLARHTLQLHARGARADGLLPMVAAGDFSARPGTIPDFTLLWIGGVARYLEYTAETDFAAAMLPVAARALETFESLVNDDGLVTGMSGWLFFDWAQTERRAQLAMLDGFLVLALEDAAAIADVLGDAGASTRWRARAARSRTALEHYWDEARGVYVDARDEDGTLGRRVSQQTNITMMLAGAPRERWDRIFQTILDEDRLVLTKTPGDPGDFAERMARQWLEPEDFDEERNVVLAQPFFCHFLHRVFALADRLDLLLPSIRRWEALVARGNGCLEEYWTAAPGLGSRAHVWSATPTYDLATYVLGVRPARPGFGRIAITPYLGDLRFAEGAVPTPHGLVQVRVDADGTGEITLPPGAAATFTFQGQTRLLEQGTTVL